GEDARQGAVLREEAGGRLLPDAGNARQTVRGIAAQKREVPVGPARDPVAALDLGLVDGQELGDAGQRIEDADLRVADQREEVAIARDDLDRLPCPCGAGRDHVLRLEALCCRDRHAEGGQGLAPRRFLRPEWRWLSGLAW